MERPDVLIIGPYPQWDMDDLESTYALHKPYLAPDADGLLTRIGASVRGIATRGELGASAKLMERLPKLEIVACYGVGTDAIDLGHARSRGIVVTNTPDVLTEDVADLGVGLLLAVCRNMVAADAHVRAGHWASSNLALSTRLHGKRVGIFSYGSGLAASMFSLKVRGSTEELSKQVDLHTRLDSRRTVAPEVYDEMCNLREKAHLKSNFEPTGSVETLLPGTYYLTKVDEMFRRKYEIKQ